MADSLGAELKGKIDNPLKFQWGSAGAGERVFYGFDVTLLIDICTTPDIVRSETLVHTFWPLPKHTV